MSNQLLQTKAQTAEVMLDLATRRNLDELYTKFGKNLFSYAHYAMKIDNDDSWDLVYNTLIKMAEKVKELTFESDAKLGAYVKTAFNNHCKNYFRNKSRKEKGTSMHSFNENASEEEISKHNFIAHQVKNKSLEIYNDHVKKQEDGEEEDSILMKKTKKALNQLEKWEKMLLLLRSQNLPYNEIAKFIDKPEAHLKVYHQRLKKKLVQIVEKLED